jgi:DNA-binding transcriptional LysR family regulator
MADEADVGVIGSAERRPGLRLERLLRDEVMLAAPPDHPFSERESVTWDEVQGQPLILREEGSGTQRSVEAALHAAGFQLPREQVVLVLGSTQSLLQAVSQGLGLGFVSALAAAPLQEVGRLSCVRLQGVDLTRDLYLAYLPERIADPVVARFLQFARTWFST